jgi:TPR repeat protein
VLAAFAITCDGDKPPAAPGAGAAEPNTVPTAATDPKAVEAPKPGKAVDLLPSGAHVRLQKLATACDGGEHRACFQLGAAFELGVGGLPKGSKTQLWERSCAPDDGATYGCLHLTSKDPTIAKAMCRTGRRDACDVILGGKDVAEAIAASSDLAQVFEGACRMGSSIVCKSMTEFRGNAASGKNESARLPATAPKEVMDAAALCDRQIAIGCSDLGRIYAFPPDAKRVGLKVDEQHARELAVRSCNDKTKIGCVIYADLLFSKGTLNDEAKKHLRDSCSAGNRAACGALVGGLDAQGSAAEKDEAAFLSLELCSEIGSKGMCGMAQRAFGP